MSGILPNPSFFSLQEEAGAFSLRLHSLDGTNRLTRECVVALEEAIQKLSAEVRPLVIGRRRLPAGGVAG